MPTAEPMAELQQSVRRVAEVKPPEVISLITLKAMRRIGALFAVECDINGHSGAQRRTVRQVSSARLSWTNGKRESPTEAK